MIVGQPPGVIVGVACFKRCKIDVLVDDFVQGVFEGAWQDLITV